MKIFNFLKKSVHNRKKFVFRGKTLDIFALPC